MPMTPRAVRPMGRTSFSGKRMDMPLSRGDEDVVLAGGDLDVDEFVVLVQVDGDDARGARVAEGLERGLLHDALRG